MGSSVILPQTGQPKTGPDPSFKTAATPNIVSFAFQNLTPPTTVYIQRDDVLQIGVRNSFVGASLRLKYRMLLPVTPKGGQPGGQAGQTIGEQNLPGGTIILGQTDFAITSDRTFNTFQVALAEGYLLGIEFSGLGGSQIRGQTYVQCFLARGLGATGISTQPLVAGYLLPQSFLGWPGSSMISALEGPGWVHTVTVGNPAAGADWSVTVPANARWRIQSFSAILTTSATVANRVPRVQLIDNAANTVWNSGPNQSIPASQNVRVSGSTNTLTAAVNVTDVLVPLPTPPLQMAGWILQFASQNLQAADQWSAIALAVEEWMEN